MNKAINLSSIIWSTTDDVLRASVSIFEIAELAGTGVQHIENHCGHVDDLMRKQTALKNFAITEKGISERK